MVSRIHLVLLSTLLLSTSLYAVGEDQFEDKLTIIARPNNNSEKTEEENKSAISSSSAPTAEASQQGWGSWLRTKASNAASSTFSFIKGGSQILVNGLIEMREQRNNLRKGVDLYASAKTAIDHAPQLSGEVHPVAANFITGCYDEMAPVIENLFINACRAGGPELASKLAADLGLVEKFADMTTGLVLPANPLDTPYIKLVSTLISGMDVTTLAGKTTKGLSPILKKQAGQTLESMMSSANKRVQFKSEGTTLVAETLLEMAAMDMTRFTENTIDQTLKSLSNDLVGKFGNDSKGVVEALLFGVNETKQQQIQTFSKVSEVLSRAKRIKDLLHPKKLVTEVGTALARRYVPTSLKMAWSQSLRNINANAGNALGSALSTALTEDSVLKLDLANKKLFKDKDLQISINVPYLEGSRVKKPFEGIAGELFQQAGKTAAQRLLEGLEVRIDKMLKDSHISYDAKTLMYTKINPSLASKVGASFLKGVIWGGYYGYKALSTTTDQAFWVGFTETLYPQFAELNQDQ